MSEHQHGHYNHHAHDRAKPIISRRWQIATVVGNAVIGAAELAGGFAASAYSLVADGAHNGADVYTYWLQSKNLLQRQQLDQEKLQRNRKIAHWVLCATSVGVATKAGVDLAMDKESVHNSLNMYAAGASVAFNGMLFGALYRGIRHRKQSGGQKMDHLEKDITKHFVFSDMPSAALALGGVYLQSKGMIGAEQVAAVASGALSAFVFRPTAKNLAHDHDHFGEVGCDHHEEHSHHHEHKTGLRQKLQKLAKLGKLTLGMGPSKREQIKQPHWRKAVAGIMSLAMTGSLVTGSAEQETPEGLLHSSKVVVQAQENAVNLQLEEIITPDIYDCIDVREEDSLWSIASHQIEQAFDKPASNAQANIVALLAANETQLENPNLIYTDQCVEMPSQHAIETLFAAPNFADDINYLNTLSWDEVQIQEHVIEEIDDRLARQVAAY